MDLKGRQTLSLHTQPYQLCLQVFYNWHNNKYCLSTPIIVWAIIIIISNIVTVAHTARTGAINSIYKFLTIIFFWSVLLCQYRTSFYTACVMVDRDWVWELLMSWSSTENLMINWYRRRANGYTWKHLILTHRYPLLSINAWQSLWPATGIKLT